MVFKRRERRPILRKVQDAVYPRRGWRRAFEYIGHRIKRLRGNVLASLMGTFFGNPITFPFIATISYRTGQLFLDTSATDGSFYGIKSAIVSGFVGTWQSMLSIVGMSEPAWGQVTHFLSAVFLPYLIGGIIPGLFCAIVCYILARPLVAAYQKTRRARLQKKCAQKQQKSVLV